MLVRFRGVLVEEDEEDDEDEEEGRGGGVKCSFSILDFLDRT
jgi:hypothetical protein